MDAKEFISLYSNASDCKCKINRGWSGGTESYLTVFDSTADFVELDDCRVEGGQLTSFASNASITAFDKTAYKGAKTLITIESDDGKVQMLEVTAVCSASVVQLHMLRLLTQLLLIMILLMQRLQLLLTTSILV